MRTRPDRTQMRQCEAGVTSTFVSVALGLARAKAVSTGDRFRASGPRILLRRQPLEGTGVRNVRIPQDGRGRR